MNRRRALESEEEMADKEWKILFAKTVDDNFIIKYIVETPGCTEFFVSVSFANDPEIANTVNGKIAINTDNPWTNNPLNAITCNISNLQYNNSQNDASKVIVLSFAIRAGLLVPISSWGSANTGAMKNVLANNQSFFMLNEDMSFKAIEKIEKIAIGSYTKWFGTGSKILVMGR